MYLSKKKKGKRTASHRYDLLPLLPSGPDGVQRELTARDSPFKPPKRTTLGTVPRPLESANGVDIDGDAVATGNRAKVVPYLP